MCVTEGMAQVPPDLAKLREQRRQAAHRLRRMIFNNDGDDVIYTKKELTPEALLALRTTPLLGSQVDSIFYSNSLCFGDALHNSHVFTPFVSKADLFKDNPMAEYLQIGLDPIKVMADFCHAHGLEILWDMRMNDTHDAGLTGYGPLLLPQLKKDHPEYLVGSADKQPPYGTWSSVNYAVPEVRDLAYRFFEEVCQKFDVDGIELDFLRHACFFKSVAWGGEATQDERDMMTDLLRRTRQMTEREGLRRGRPILIAIRVPDSVEYSRAIGLDIEKWLAEGLVDILSGTCYSQLNRWEVLVGLGHKYDVPVYPSLSESRVTTDTRFQRNSLESYRARAARAWAAGADGIYMFNYFNPRGPVWRELGDPKALARKDKLYFVTVRNGRPDAYLANGARFRNVPIITPENPQMVGEKSPNVYDLYLAENLQQEPKPAITCHLQALTAAPLNLAINDHPIQDVTVNGAWSDFKVPPEALKSGLNKVAVSAAPQPAPTEDEWTLTFDGKKLPDAPWQKMGWYVGCSSEVRDDGLLLADRSTESGSYAYYWYPGFIDPAREAVVEARVKTLSGWSSLMIENGTNGEEVMLYPDQVQMRSVGLAAPARTDDAFHTYRIVILDHDMRIFMDDKLIIDGTGKFTSPAPAGGRSGVFFGGANSPNQGEAVWQMVRVRNPAATLLDVVLKVDYPE